MEALRRPSSRQVKSVAVPAVGGTWQSRKTAPLLDGISDISLGSGDADDVGIERVT